MKDPAYTMKIIEVGYGRIGTYPAVYDLYQTVMRIIIGKEDCTHLHICEPLPHMENT
jgi:hypothetical protein